MNTEWINTQENVAHKFISDAYSALALVRIQRSDGYGPLWAMLDPLDPMGRQPLAPVVQPAPGIWPPVFPTPDQWTVDNVTLGGVSLKDLFLATYLPPQPAGSLVPVKVVPAVIGNPGSHFTVVPDNPMFAENPRPPVGPGALLAVTADPRTVAVAVPDQAIEAGGDIIGSRPLAFAMRAGDTPVMTRSLNEIASLLSQGYKILRADGTFADLTEFQGGVLADGEPLTVWLGRGWIPGQQEALLAAGITPKTELQKVFSAGVSSRSLVLGGAIAAGLLLWSRSRK